MRFLNLVKKSILPVMICSTLASAQLMSGSNLDVIRVGKTGISRARIDSLSDALAKAQARGRQVPPEAMKQVRWAVIDNLVGQELVKLEAKALNIKVPKARIDSVAALFKSQYPSTEVFKNELKKNNISEKQFNERIEQQLQSDIILEQKVPYPKDPTDKQIAAYWELNKSKVPLNDTISGARILLKSKKGESKQAVADKKELLKGLAAQVRLGKASFATLAAQYSDDADARKTGGVMNKFIAKSKGADFAKAIGNLNVGDISDVFSTTEGLQIFMLTEKNDGKFENYKVQIEYILRVQAEQERQLKVKAYLDELAAKYKVQYLNKDYTPENAIGGSK
ncbi:MULTISPECIES: peptidylprolyl isomerase [Fibrobacteraceae]|uniref:Parvulin-like peptidyl-prolyl isomerase n=1 Tax=Fibrobacter intestinalis TaxID=28122 RepID=A0A1M6R989_9BACT|nr:MULTISPECIES: peptidylprolyl isomerase [Fibrobacteraceae]MCI6874336.1 peptidylprolyl isomerase [Hallerella sp.]MDD7300169.1 peptidylprolyl isomerase [Fibrobacter intestinalis]PBC66999.1 parvulin-like peptidyl-prolyl isomerase [Fibrobacter sp. UWS1]SHK29021.1 Parvulin-like peptidyl-prolyl isomerase [Fibrobacter intestinalis]